MSNMYLRTTQMASELRKAHKKPNKLSQLDALPQKQDSIEMPNETTFNVASGSRTLLEGGGSNSNINHNENQEPSYGVNHFQQSSSEGLPSKSTKSLKNQQIPEQRIKKPNPVVSHNYQMYAVKTGGPRALISASQPTSSTNLYSGIEGGRTIREAVPEMLSTHQLQATVSHQNMSASSLSNLNPDNKLMGDKQPISGGVKSSANLPQSPPQKRNYLYCIDTRQIIAMINYCIDMIQVPCKTINNTIEQIEQQQRLQQTDNSDWKNKILNDLAAQGNHISRSKSTNEAQSKKSATLLNTQPKILENYALDDSNMTILQHNQLRKEIFCSGNKEILSLVGYFNHKLKNHIDSDKASKLKKGLFKLNTQEPEKQELSRIDSFTSLDFCKVFSLDQKTQNSIIKFATLNSQSVGPAIDQETLSEQIMKFTYLVENEKILSKQMFYIDVQRDSFCQTLKEIRDLLTKFIQRKYKNCITKIGFSSQTELYNIFNKMFNSRKGFFNNIFVRKVLSCFWMSIREIFFQIRLKQFDEHLTSKGDAGWTNLFSERANSVGEQMPISMANNPNSVSLKQITKLSQTEELMLKSNFYMRLELLARGRQIFEPYMLELQMQTLHALILPASNLQNSPRSNKTFPFHNPSGSTFDKNSSGSCVTLENCYSKLYPLHQAIFDSNLRQLSKLLKQEVEGTFYINKNTLDPCGNTPLMLAVKLGNLDAVKILSDVYTCPKLRPLPDLMNAKEVAMAMKHQPILKTLISSNQKLKQQFFEENKTAIFSVLESIPDFQVDLNLTCDSNLFPVFSSVAPSDTYKIYKQGSNLRLDMTLLGLQGFNLLKGNITVLYKGRFSEDAESAGDLLIIDNKLQTVNSVFNRNQEGKINTEIQNILTGKQILKKYQTHSSSIQLEKDRSNKPVFKTINDFECQKWILKSRYTMTKYGMNLNQIDQINGLKSFQDYVENLQVDFLQLIEPQLSACYAETKENGGSEQNGINTLFSHRFRSGAPKGHDTTFGENGIPNTSRVNLGGTSKLDRQNGGLSSREGSKIRNIAGEGHQVYTQEDQINNTSDRYGIFGQRGSVQTQANILANNKQIFIKKSQQKQIQANLWLSKFYPFDIEQLLPLFHVLSFCSKQIRQFNKFLLKYPLPKNTFPIEARIPLMMTMEAVFSFKNMHLGFNDPKVFELDKVVAQKQQENLAIYAKQQISYLNQHSSLDTQEDKQARALREIYKLCKTDEGDSGDNHNDDLYRIIDEATGKNAQNEDGNESESSEHIKDRFNRMKDEQYDINNDLLLIEENDDEDIQSISINKKKSKCQQVEEEKQENVIKNQSRNFANKSSFHDIKQSFTQSEFIKMRKSGQVGRTPSMQFSLQSDITESIEVSERSFNDKLAKLQIHSFQNVKFMSQLKRNRGSRDSIDPNIEKFLNEQLMLHSQQPTKLGEYKVNQCTQVATSSNKARVPEILQFQRTGQQLSNFSQGSSVQMENIYDSKLNEQRPKINKSLGQHQVKNNLHLYAKGLKSQAIEMGQGKPPIATTSQRHIRQKNIAQDFSYQNRSQQVSIEEHYKQMAKPPLKEGVYLPQPNVNIGNSIVSMGCSNFDNTSSVNMYSISSLSYANLESRNIGQPNLPSSTNESSKVAQSIGSSLSNMVIPGSKHSRVLDNFRVKKMIRNQNGNQNYLNTIESEGNLPTQQFGKGEQKFTKDCNNLSQRSIHSLDEAEGDQNEAFNSDKSHVISNQKLIDQSNLIKQEFSYEKQKLTQHGMISSDSLPSTVGPTINIQALNQQARHPYLPSQKLNFFQKVTNFISESITDRKHHQGGVVTNQNEYSSQQEAYSKTSSKYQMAAMVQDQHTQDRRSNEDNRLNKLLDRSGSQNTRTNIPAGKNDRVMTYKKLKRAVATPKNHDFVSPMRQYVGPNTVGRNDIKRDDSNEISAHQNQSAFQLQQMINQQLIRRKQSANGAGPNISVIKPQEPHRNTTQTDGSISRDGKHKVAPSQFLSEDQSPMQEGQIHYFNRLN